nr:immunoglobulin heavy chain junction region [Mus musculus]
LRTLPSITVLDMMVT